MRWFVVVAVALVGCKATTGRPGFVSFPEAEHTEIGFDLANKDTTVFLVTDTLAARLRADSIPVARVKRIDGYLETGWFDARTLQPTDRRPLGPDVVKVRAWVDPGQPGYSKVEVETVYIPKADPSLPARELEQPVPLDHPVNRRVGDLLKDLAERYGIPAEQQEPKKTDGKTKHRAVADSGAAADTGAAAKAPPPVEPKPVPKPPTPTPVPPPAPPPPPPPSASPFRDRVGRIQVHRVNAAGAG